MRLAQQVMRIKSVRFHWKNGELLFIILLSFDKKER